LVSRSPECRASSGSPYLHTALRLKKR
jgi:hypothetical protein